MYMNKKLLLYLLSLKGVFISSCDYFDHRIEIINLSNYNIVLETYSDSVVDTNENNLTEYYYANIIEVGQKTNLTQSGTNGWPFYIRRSKNQMLNICVFNFDSLKKYQTINFLVKHKIYKQYSFSEREMVKRNWVIEFH